MRIGIDISQVLYGTGVSVYTKEIVTNLLKIDEESKYVLFGGSLRRGKELRGMSDESWKKAERKIWPVAPTMADFVWNRLHVCQIEKLIGKIDVFHSSDWTQPPTGAFKVTTVHDLAPIKYPAETPKKIVEVHKRRLYWVLKECDRIIVPTISTKVDLIGLGASENKIRVIYEAAGENFRKAGAESVSLVKRKFYIHEDYIMAVGMGMRKNTQNLIDAYNKSNKNYKLVIVGGKRVNTKDERGVIYTGYVSDEELIALYSGARALVYPSLSEGFGLPILQAFACECPVVTSNLGSMAEVAGDAAILVDPMDSNSITMGIDKAVNAPKTLTALGLKRVKEFSWAKAATQTLAVYKESLGK